MLVAVDPAVVGGVTPGSDEQRRSRESDASPEPVGGGSVARDDVLHRLPDPGLPLVHLDVAGVRVGVGGADDQRVALERDGGSEEGAAGRGRPRELLRPDPGASDPLVDLHASGVGIVVAHGDRRAIDGDRVGVDRELGDFRPGRPLELEDVDAGEPVAASHRPVVGSDDRNVAVQGRDRAEEVAVVDRRRDELGRDPLGPDAVEDEGSSDLAARLGAPREGPIAIDRDRRVVEYQKVAQDERAFLLPALR